MNRKPILFVVALLVLLPTTFNVVAQPSGLPVTVPREDLFVADQIIRYSVIDNFNLWIIGPPTGTRHALMMETLWYRDQENGQRMMGASTADPIYNEDFTQLSVVLHDSIYWSDGEQFNADDLVFTVETLKANSDLNSSGWNSQLNQFMESVEKVDDYNVTFHLSQPNPRFHTLFEARWNGIYMMPEHVFSQVEDFATFTNGSPEDPPVVLGLYQPVESDPNGYWTLLKRRDDWERTAVGQLVGNGGPPYVLTILYGDSTKKVIAMARGELDVFFNVDVEAFQSVLASTPTAKSWYPEFPWAYPNEVSSRYLRFNFESQPWFANKDVRWALALAIDIVELQTNYIGGIAKVTPMAVPYTPTLAALYHTPMEEWFQNLEIDVAGETYKPYDASVPDRIAEWAEAEGYEQPAETPRASYGSGWWKFDTDTAAKLLEHNGFTRDGDGNWWNPDGERFAFSLQAAPDEPDSFRTANAAHDMWEDFGIDVDLQGVERSVWRANFNVGQFEVDSPWTSLVLPDGDGWPNLRGRHSRYYSPSGEAYNALGGGSAERLQDPVLDELIDAMEGVHPDDPANLDLMYQFLQHWVENMYYISTVSFKKFVTWNELYWTGFPSSENPVYMPLYWFNGGRFAFAGLQSTGG